MADISKLAVILTANSAGFSAGMKSAGRDVEQFTAQVDSAGTKFAGFATGLAAAGAALLGGIGLGRGLQLAADFEDTEMAMTVLLKSADKAKAVLAGLDTYATQTSYGLSELGESAKSLLALGSTDKTVGAEIRMLGDVAAAAKIPLNELATIYGKMRSGKFIQAEELNQLSGRGIPVFEQFAKIMGVSADQVKKLASENKITFPVLQQAFVNLTKAGGDYENMAVKMGETTNGVFAQMKDAVDKSLRTIGQMLIKELSVKDGMKGIIAWIESFGKVTGSVFAAAVKWVKDHAATLKTLGKVLLVVGSAVLIYKGAIMALTIAQKAWQLSQIAVLALQGPKGWAVLAGAAVAAGAAYLLVSEVSGAVADEMKKADAAAKGLAEATSDTGRAALEAQAAADLQKSKTDGLAKGVADLTAKLKEQVATFGMSSTQADIWKLAQQGANEEQLAGVRALDAQLQALERNKRAMEDMANAAKRIVEDIKDPWDKLADQLAEINKLEKAGLLTAEQAEKASAKASDDLLKSQKLKDVAKRDFGKNFYGEKTGAFERRFTAGIPKETLTPWEKLVKSGETTAKNSGKIATNTGKMASAKAPATVVIGR